MKERGKRFVNPKKKFIIHSDMLDFFKNYQKGKSFQEQVGDKRDAKLAEGELFWNTDHDAEMLETARERSMSPEFIKYCKDNNITFE